MIATGEITARAIVSYTADSGGITVTGLQVFGVNIPIRELSSYALDECEDLAKDEHAAYLRGLEETRHDHDRFTEAAS